MVIYISAISYILFMISFAGFAIVEILDSFFDFIKLRPLSAKFGIIVAISFIVCVVTSVMVYYGL